VVDKLITYLESDYRYPRGRHLDDKEKNAEQTLELARKRVKELNLRYVVVASYTGRTAIKAAQAFEGMDVTVIAVVGWGERMRLSIENQRTLERLGVQLYRGTHTFHGASSALIHRFGGASDVGIIQETLRLFSQGTKVCVEIALMAADAGLVPVDEEIMTLGGTGQWCDTAIVIKPSFANKLFDPVERLEIKEIVVLPRNKMVAQ
jgi:hypothetical protein